jgi:CHAT domain-containing protein
VNALRTLFGAPASRVFLGAEARERNLKTEDISAYRFVHFATHGYFDEAQPARSGLVLAQQAGDTDDGILQAREIFRLRLNADVVTLSACQSGLGKLLAGEGVMGLSRAFFYAGAQSLVVSLWNVNDAATAELMKVFYTHLKAGVARDEAMRRAKLALAKGPNRAWRHPYFWAPFVFLGDPLPAR